MTYSLKPLHKDAVPRALERAERYRLLNEPWEAESICRDVLGVEPDNQTALVTLLLAVTDQFGEAGIGQGQAQSVLATLRGEYERAYYAGVISERWAKAALRGGAPGQLVRDWYVAAMQSYEQAERSSPPGNDDAVLRWNACVRQLQAHPEWHAAGQGDVDSGFDHVPPRAPR